MKKYLAEFIGTFALVFCGTGAIIIDQVTHGAVTHLGVSMTFGLIVLAMIYALGSISGAHMNPAVSIGFTVAGLLPLKQLAPYIISQLAGAFLASIVLRVMFPVSPGLGETLPYGSDMQSFILEIILTFFLMFVIIQVATGAKETGILAGIAIASVVGLEAAFAGPISGASMNPARSLAPAVISGHLQSVWVYLVAPVIGAVLAVLATKILKVEKPAF